MTVEQFKSQFDALAPNVIGVLTLHTLEEKYQYGSCCNGNLGIVLAGSDIQSVTLVGFTDFPKLLFAVAVLLDVMLEYSVEDRNQSMEQLGLYDGSCLLGAQICEKGHSVKIRFNTRFGVFFSIQKEG